MSVQFAGYQASRYHVCSTSSPTPYSRFAVRYVHGFCLMLPSDTPLSGYALALLASSFRPVTADHIMSQASPGTAAYASCQAHVSIPRQSRGLYLGAPQRGDAILGRSKRQAILPTSSVRLAYLLPLGSECRLSPLLHLILLWIQSNLVPRNFLL